jgi:hypothetical protein
MATQGAEIDGPDLHWFSVLKEADGAPGVSTTTLYRMLRER